MSKPTKAERKIFVETLTKAADEIGMSLTNQQLEQFAFYYETLIDWNKKFNLTTIVAPEEVAVKHIIDSLSAYEEKLFPPEASLLDLGTGAGFPGLPLKIWRPDISLTLMDSTVKRLNFLAELTNELEIEATILHGRAEDAGQKEIYREKYDLVTARAVARLNILAEYALPLVRIGGYFLALKGAKFEEERAEAKGAIKTLGGGGAVTRPVTLPGLSDKRAIIIVPKIKQTPRNFPRLNGLATKKPLR